LFSPSPWEEGRDEGDPNLRTNSIFRCHLFPLTLTLSLMEREQDQAELKL
jgi:hypothetical protein